MPPNYQQEVAEHRLIVERDGEALARWLARCEDGMRRSLRKFAQTVDIEVILQETALRVWQAAPQVTPDGRPAFLLRWATRVARNLAVDSLRHSGVVTPPIDVEDLEAPPAPPADHLLRQRISVCFAKLTPKLKKAINARMQDGGEAPDRELAQIAGMTFDAFRQNVARARAALELCLSGFGINVRNVR